jgi:hypothetical protein
VFLRNGGTAKIDYEMEERNGKFFCLHDDCKDKDDQSFKTGDEVSEHWSDKHAVDEGKEDSGKNYDSKCLVVKHPQPTSSIFIFLTPLPS